MLQLWISRAACQLQQLASDLAGEPEASCVLGAWLECKAPPRLWPAFCKKKTANIVSLLENKHTNKNPQAQNIQTEIGRKKNPATKGKYCTAKQLGRAYVATLSYTFILGHAVSVLATHGCQSESHVFDQMHGNT